MGFGLRFCPTAMGDSQGCGACDGDLGRDGLCRWALAASSVQLQNHTAPLLLKHPPWLPSALD